MSGHLALAEHEPKWISRLTTSSLPKRIWRKISQLRRRQLISLMGVMVITSFAEVISISAVLPFLAVLMTPESVFSSPLIQPLILRLGITEAQQLPLPLTLLFICAALFSGVMRLILLWLQTRLGFAIGADFSTEIYTRTLYQPYSVHVTRNSSEVISAIANKTTSVINYCLLPFLSIISSSLILTAIMVTLIIIDPLVAITVFGSIGITYIAIALGAKKRLNKDSYRISRESNKVIKALQEGLGGIRDVLIDGAQSTYSKIYQDADLPLRRSQANIQIISGAPRFIIESIGMILIALLAYVLTANTDSGSDAVLLLGVLAVSAQRLLPALQLIYHSVSHIRGHQEYLKDILELLEQPMPEYLNKPQIDTISYSKYIELKKVFFRYKENGPWILANANLTIPKGSRIGITGSTGSGKSSMVDLVMGLLQPSQGEIRIDGVLLSRQNSHSWQAHVAHVPQAIFLTDATIAENIAFGLPREKIDYERLKNAAYQAQISRTIESWEKQYDTSVGERGVRLSGGQRQRIGIARALYRQADVIVFDEATSALDYETEEAVIEAIDKIGKHITIIIVAHRLTTLKKCDQIIRLDEGQIECFRNYDEMISKKILKK